MERYKAYHWISIQREIKGTALGTGNLRLTAIFVNPLVGTSDHSDDEEIDPEGNSGDNESDAGLEGAVGGESLPTRQSQLLRDSRSSEEKRTSLLDELQKEIDRIRLLSPTGQSMCG